jgi:hypothetical protein
MCPHTSFLTSLLAQCPPPPPTVCVLRVVSSLDCLLSSAQCPSPPPTAVCVLMLVSSLHCLLSSVLCPPATSTTVCVLRRVSSLHCFLSSALCPPPPTTTVCVLRRVSSFYCLLSSPRSCCYMYICVSSYYIILHIFYVSLYSMRARAALPKPICCAHITALLLYVYVLMLLYIIMTSIYKSYVFSYSRRARAASARLIWCVCSYHRTPTTIHMSLYSIIFYISYLCPHILGARVPRSPRSNYCKYVCPHTILYCKVVVLQYCLLPGYM